MPAWRVELAERNKQKRLQEGAHEQVRPPALQEPLAHPGTQVPAAAQPSATQQPDWQHTSQQPSQASPSRQPSQASPSRQLSQASPSRQPSQASPSRQPSRGLSWAEPSRTTSTMLSGTATPTTTSNVVLAAEQQHSQAMAAAAEAESRNMAMAMAVSAARTQADELAHAAEAAAADEAVTMEAAVMASVEREAALAEASLDPAGVSSSGNAGLARVAAAEVGVAEEAATDASIRKAAAVEKAVAAAVRARALEEDAAAAHIAVQRARAVVQDTAAALEHAKSVAEPGRRGEAALSPAVPAAPAAPAAPTAPLDATALRSGSTYAPTAEVSKEGSPLNVLPPRSFDSAALDAIEQTGQLLPAAALPGAVAAVFASLRAAHGSGAAAIQARIDAAKERRVAAEVERDALLEQVKALRAFAPTLPPEELAANLELEVSKRKQLQGEFRLVKSHIEDIAARMASIQSHHQQRPAPIPQKPMPPVLRNRGWERGPTAAARELTPSGMEAAVVDIGKTAASLSGKFAARPNELGVATSPGYD